MTTDSPDYAHADALARGLWNACEFEHDPHATAVRRAEAFGRIATAYALADPDAVERIVEEFEARRPGVAR